MCNDVTVKNALNMYWKKNRKIYFSEEIIKAFAKMTARNLEL